MEVAVLTVGDELLAGDTENTNASWLARALSGRGVTVARILVVPDDEAVIEETVRAWAEAFDAVVVTGGLGGTHDDVTLAGVAAAFDVPLVVDADARADVVRTVEAYREANPEVAARYPEFRVDPDAWAALPEGADPLTNSVGLSPGCRLGSVYVLPGPPEEMRAMFELVVDEFGGDVVAETLYTPAPESALTEPLAAIRERFDVTVGSYPSRGDESNRIKVSGRDASVVDEAVAWLRERVDVVAE